MTTFTVTTLDDFVAADTVLSLREALAQADLDASADIINFADGVRGGTIELDPSRGQLVVNSSVTIFGGLDEVAVPGDPGTTIDAGGDSRVLLVQGGSAASPVKVLLERLTITGGATESVDGAGGGIRGGANTELSLLNTTVTGNSTETASARGGGIATLGSLSLTASTVSNNSTEGPGASGGGIEAAGTVTLERSTVSGNSTEASGATGGGIHAATANPTNSTVVGNDTQGVGPWGGGIFGSTVTLVNSTVSDNSTAGQATDGGGVVSSSTLSVTNSIVAGNRVTHPVSDGPDLGSAITSSNGHNIFGSDVAGNAAGDLEGIAASALFAGGLSFNGGVTQNLALLESNANPALGGADPDDAPFGDQRSLARPDPAGTDPDVGAFESSFVPKAVLSIAATSADHAEGNAGTTDCTFTVTRGGVIGTAASAHWEITSTAADAADFGGLLPSGSVNFAPGATQVIVAVQVAGDTAVEPDEAFQITLSDPASGTAFGTASATGTIRNDDAAAPPDIVDAAPRPCVELTVTT